VKVKKEILIIQFLLCEQTVRYHFILGPRDFFRISLLVKQLKEKNQINLVKSDLGE
jgi:hypothetical protein